MFFDGIVRNRLKIASTITNARCFIAIQKEFGSFYNYTLSFFPEQKPIVNNFKSLKEIPITTPESDAMSKDMKKRGFKFFGSTICYAHMQATGFVNDHLEGCFCQGKDFYRLLGLGVFEVITTSMQQTSDPRYKWCFDSLDKKNENL